ncbi:MAG TPA: 5'-3' exonuclease H3TH domain-containing protein, partial [Spirochaetia bacterium]|nr:5'-3' exonuclease H3TH domain-containing protein [Spirochaetia bacterium]
MSRELYLIDGYSVIYRGYFAFLNRPLLNPLGKNSSSVFVFFRTLFQIIRDRAPETLAVAMDSRVPTFRHKRYEQYKATRQKAPEDLHAQVPVIEEILEALGVPCVRADGFEADDVIATLAEGCRASGTPCWILSGDKDILQLIGGNVRLLAQEKGSTDLVEYSRDKVFELRGVYPEQIIDFLSLTGDSSDNIPGVPGIGEKTAQKLLGQFGTLEAIYQKLAEVTPESVRKKLEAGREAAMLSHELVTLNRGVPGVPTLDQLGLPDLSSRQAATLFEREGMKTLVTELKALARKAEAGLSPKPDTKPAAKPREASAAPVAGDQARAEAQGQAELFVSLKQTAPGACATITSVSELDLWLGRARRAGAYSLHVQTDGADEMKARPLGFSLCAEEGKACYVPIRATGAACIPEETVRSRLAGLLEDASLRYVGHSVKYDYKVLRRWGIRPANVHFDTMIAAWVLESQEGTYGLDRLAETRLGYRAISVQELGGKDQALEDVPVQKVTDYAGESADLALRLHTLLARDLEAEGLLSVFHGIEMPLLTVLSEMELTGIRLLPTELAAYSAELEKSLAAIEQEIYALVG